MRARACRPCVPWPTQRYAFGEDEQASLEPLDEGPEAAAPFTRKLGGSALSGIVREEPDASSTPSSMGPPPMRATAGVLMDVS